MVLLAKKYKNQNPGGWFMSEKLDGVRAIWTGQNFISRNGKEFFVPDEFKQGMPAFRLDGELWIKRGAFQKTVGIVRRSAPTMKDFRGIKYMVFDAPDAGGVFSDRYKFLLTLNLPKYVRIVKHFICKGEDHLDAFEERIVENGGEGVMLRDPNSFYENRRSNSLLKVVRFHSDEAKITGYKPGKGKYEGKIGALVCKAKKTTFNIGAGLDDLLRDRPPDIGALISYSYRGLTDGGKPRFPSFLSIRDYE